MGAPFTAVRNTPNKSPRQNVARKGVCLHHAATESLSALRRLAMGAKEVSATAIVKDGAAELLMADGFRAWSLADAWGDSAFRSVECANESSNGWTISDASHWTLARLVAYWAERDGFWPHRDGDPKTWTVIGHREFNTIYGGSYPTACPGAMDLGLVTRRAQGLLNGSKPAGGDAQLIEEAGMAQVQYYERSEKGYAPEWMIGGIELQGGFEVTTDKEQAQFWSRLYRNGSAPVKLERELYMDTQTRLKQAAAKHQAWFFSQIKKS